MISCGMRPSADGCRKAPRMMRVIMLIIRTELKIGVAKPQLIIFCCYRQYFLFLMSFFYLITI